MKAIILAAGLGTRLRPMTENTPKALVQVNQKPLIEYQIEFLKEKGINDIIIIVGYLKEQFDYLKEKYGVRLVFNDKYADYNNFYSLYLVIVLFSHQSFAEVANGQLLGLMIVFAAFDMISYLAYYIAINRLQPAKATGLNVSYVVWTVLFAVVFLGAPLDILTIITSLVVIAGVYIIIKE